MILPKNILPAGLCVLESADRETLPARHRCISLSADLDDIKVDELACAVQTGTQVLMNLDHQDGDDNEPAKARADQPRGKTTGRRIGKPA